MRQRNDTGYGADVMAWPTDEHPDRRPFFVAAGEETDLLDELIPGFTRVDEPAAPDAAETPAKPKKAAAATKAASTEGGEPA